MLNYLFMLGLAAAPISEARGAIFYGLNAGINPYSVFILSVLVNIAVIPVIFWFLKQARFRKLANRLFGNRMWAKIGQWKEKFEIYEELVLLIFVAVPLPVTGAWTGTFIAELLSLNRAKAIAVIAIGVIIAASLVFTGAWIFGKII